MRNHLPQAPHGTQLADGVHADELTGADVPDVLPETFGYTLKRKLLGPPLVNEQMAEERLSRPLALGVLSCDGISSAAYGTEEMLIELVPIVGLAAFTLILPMTLVILAGIALVVLSYREVVSVYTRAGGSYVVARENFGPRVAQVAAVALLIDYTVTVAVQIAAGSAAIVSAFPQLANIPVIGPYILIVISVIAVAIMCYGNLRGIREAGPRVRAAHLPLLRLGRADDHRRPHPRGDRRPAARHRTRPARTRSGTAPQGCSASR